ncbi:MAG: HD domain-containing phosphohydrolase [bacterium]
MLRKIGQNLNLKDKFLFGSICLIAVLGVTVLFLVQTIVSQKLLLEVRERGVLIAKNLAAESVNPILSGRTEELQLFINECKNSKQDIEYIFVLDAQNRDSQIQDASNRVLAHTFERGFPSGLKNANNIGQGEKQNAKSLIIDEKNILDIVVPVLEGKMGVVRVGISEEPIRKTVSNIIKLIMGIIIAVLLLGGIGVFVLTTAVTNPIYDLVHAAKTVITGNLTQRVNVKTRDEIGQLGLTFNNMIEALQKSKKEIIQSKEYVRNIIHYTYEALFVVSNDGYITTVNGSACGLLGYGERDLVGQPVENIFSGEDFMVPKTKFRDLIKEECLRDTEKVFLSKNGEKIPVVFSSSIMRDNKGDIQGVILVAQSIMDCNRLEEKLQHTLITLRRAMKGAIHAMVLAAEKRDPFIAGHRRRVSDLARAIAKEMGLATERIDGIRMCAIVHDLGKIFIPPKILAKTKKLTKGEYDIIKTHPAAGYEILKEIEFPWPIAEIEIQHHERIDGSGYPNGLMGKDILLESKILAVSDVFEAIAFKRSYREALGTDKALEKISQGKGILYEPDVVDACAKIFVEKEFQFREGQTT